MTPLALGLVIFDCDGVLVDSEPASRRVLAAEAARLGWRVTEEVARRFTGLRWTCSPFLNGSPATFCQVIGRLPCNPA